MNATTIKDEVKEIEDYRKAFGHVGFAESGKLIQFCNFLLSSQQEESVQAADTLIEFWSDIKNLENASLEDVQKDILAYLKQRQGYKNQVVELKKALTFYASESSYQSATIEDGIGWDAPEVMEDKGKIAQQALKGESQ